MFKVDLHQKNVELHWASAPTDISQILNNMEISENWVLDDDETFNQAFIDWAGKIGGAISIETLEDKQSDFIKIISFMKSSKAFYLIKKLEDEYPGFVADTLATSIDGIIEAGEGEDTRHFIVYRDRLTALYRVEFLERIYSNERAGALKIAISETIEKHGGLYGSE